MAMKIAMVSPYDFAWPGGVNAHVAQLSAELRERGHTVSVVAPHSPSQPLAVGVEDGQFIPMGRPVPVSAAGSKARVCLSFWLYPRIRALMDRERFDVVHLHEPLAPILPLMVLQHSKTVNVGTFHAYSEREQVYRVALRAVGRWQQRLHGRIAVSPAARSYVSPHFPQYNYRVIPNGVDYRRFADAEPLLELRDGKINLLFVGRKDGRKGLPYLLDAFALLSRVRNDLRLIIVGPGEPDRRCAALLDSFIARDPNSVLMAGRVSDEMLPRYYASADVFCSPATGGESFGIVLLEAMATGLPVVASDIDGYRDVITNQENGLLTSPREPRSIADAVLRVIDDAQLSGRLSAAGRRTARRYRWDRVASEVEDYYHECIQEANHSGITR